MVEKKKIDYNKIGVKTIKNRKEVEKLERKLLESKILSLEEKYNILDAMYKEAIFLNVFPLKNFLEGLEILVKTIKIINSV